jgi:uncharacterized membrane protein YoaK (UPF0700 family)
MKYRALTEAAVAGYVDALGFVALFGLFTVHVTGNFVLLGAVAAGGSTGVVLKLAAFPAFISGIALAKGFALAFAHDGQARLERVLLWTQAALLGLFLATGILASPILDSGNWRVLLCGITGAMAMGIQNARPRLVGETGAPTTMMTGNVTQAVLDALSVLFERDSSLNQAALSRIFVTLRLLAGFALGAVGGGAGFAFAGFWALVVPIAALAVIAASLSFNHVSTLSGPSR